MASSSKQALKAFCYSDRDFDESQYVSATLAQTSAQLNQLELGPKQLWESLPEVLWYQDEPVHTITAVVGFHLSGLAAQNGVKVVMNGQGADETLGGYPSYFKDRWTSLLIAKGYRALKSEINDFVSIHGGNSQSIAHGVVAHTFKSGIRHFSLYRQFVRNKTLRQYTEDDWFDPEFTKHLPTTSELEKVDLRSTLERAMERAPLPLYLRIEDRNSMAHSVEARLPFLDYQLVELAHSLPDEWKLRGPWNKYLLRESMKNKIPENVRTRPDKMGFPTPFGRWLKENLYEDAVDIINDTSFDRSIFRVESIRRDLERHKNGEGDYSRKIFDILQFQIWRNLNPACCPS
jgi:asparagine synthase (glutamine-hydrolysing)